MKYRDENGNVLYGFSQQDLAKTNRELKQTNKNLRILIVLFLLLLVVVGGMLMWVQVNDIITKLIYI